MRRPPKGGYFVTDAKGMSLIRPNKLAAGMTKTIERSHHSGRLGDAALRLCVRGTCDRLGWPKNGVRVITVLRYGISDTGRKRLQRLKLLRQENTTHE